METSFLSDWKKQFSLGKMSGGRNGLCSVCKGPLQLEWWEDGSHVRLILRYAYCPLCTIERMEFMGYTPSTLAQHYFLDLEHKGVIGDFVLTQPPFLGYFVPAGFTHIRPSWHEPPNSRKVWLIVPRESFVHDR